MAFHRITISQLPHMCLLHNKSHFVVFCFALSLFLAQSLSLQRFLFHTHCLDYQTLCRSLFSLSSTTLFFSPFRALFLSLSRSSSLSFSSSLSRVFTQPLPLPCICRPIGREYWASNKCHFPLSSPSKNETFYPQSVCVLLIFNRASCESK